jgi:hypothetical protein
VGERDDSGREWKPPAGAGSWAQLQALFTIAGGLVGAAAYIYLLGGFVVGLKLKAAQLPTDDVMQVLDRNRLLAVGVRATVFEAFLLGTLAIALVTLQSAKKTESKSERESSGNAGADKAEDNPWTTWKNFLHGAIVAILAGTLLSRVALAVDWEASFAVTCFLAVLAAAFWVLGVLPDLDSRLEPRSRGRWAVKTGLTVIACLLGVFVLAAPAGVLVLVLLLFLHLSHLLRKLVDLRNPVTLVPVVLGMGAAMSLVVAVYVATPPVALDRAAVYLENGEIARGGYVGQSGEGVFLAGCNADPVDPTVTTHVRLRIIAADRIRRIKLAGKNFVIDYGENPSLADLGLAVVSQESIEELTQTVSIDVRDPELACGRRRSVQLLSTRPRGERSLGTQAVRVVGGGSLELTGDQFRTQVRHVTEASLVDLPLRLDRSSRRAHLCGATVRGWIDVRFTLADGATEHRKALVTRPVQRVEGRCPRPIVHRGSALNAR